MIHDVLADRAHAKGRTGSVLSPKTLGIYRTKLGHVSRIFGKDSLLFDVDYPGVGRYIAQRTGEGAGQHTLHKELVHLRFGLRLMQEAGRYPHNVAHVTRLGRFAVGYVPRKRYLPWEEIPKLLTAILAQHRFVSSIWRSSFGGRELRKAEPSACSAVRLDRTTHVCSQKIKEGERGGRYDAACSAGFMKASAAGSAITSGWLGVCA